MNKIVLTMSVHRRGKNMEAHQTTFYFDFDLADAEVDGIWNKLSGIFKDEPNAS